MKPLLLLYRTGFAPTSGTSVELRRLLAGREKQVMHVMWDPAEAGDVSIALCGVAPEVNICWPFPFRRGRGVYLRWRQRVHDRAVIADLEQRSGARSERAWVLCMREGDAKRARSLLQAAGNPPFVLHVMDLLDENMSLEAAPCFHDLVKRASRLLCISRPIAEWAEKAGAKSVNVLRCTSDVSTISSRRLIEPLRLAIVGTIWSWNYAHNSSLELLAKAWGDIRRKFPGVTVHYVGSSGSLLPPALRPDLTDHGRLPTREFEEILGGCHVALLPVSHPPDTVARFSLPSRLADYLACGLPTIVSVEPGTAIHEFVEPLLGRCAANVQTPEELVAAIGKFCASPLAWAEASSAAADFAAEHLSARRGQQELFSYLDACR